MSDNYETVLRRWVVLHLGAQDRDVAEIETDVVGGCGFGTCELNTTEITVTMRDGERWVAEQEFGLFLDDIVSMDLNDDGTPRGPGAPPLFALTPAS